MGMKSFIVSVLLALGFSSNNTENQTCLLWIANRQVKQSKSGLN